MTTSTHMRIEEDTLVDPTYEEIHEEIKTKAMPLQETVLMNLRSRL